MIHCMVDRLLARRKSKSDNRKQDPGVPRSEHLEAGELDNFSLHCNAPGAPKFNAVKALSLVSKVDTALQCCDQLQGISHDAGQKPSTISTNLFGDRTSEEKLFLQDSSNFSLVGPMQRLSMSEGAKRSSNRKVSAETRKPGFGSHNANSIGFGGVSCRLNKFSALILHDRRPSSVIPENCNAGSACGTTAWLSLDGRVMDLENATSFQSKGFLGREAAVAWEGFTPLQRVLMVAVVAASALSAKNKNVKELTCLQNALNDRDKTLALMRQELSHLWEQFISLKEFVQQYAGKLDEEAEEQVCYASTPSNLSSLMTLQVVNTPKSALGQFVESGKAETFQFVGQLNSKPRGVPCECKPINKGHGCDEIAFVVDQMSDRAEAYKLRGSFSDSKLNMSLTEVAKDLTDSEDYLPMNSSFVAENLGSTTPQLSHMQLKQIATPYLPPKQFNNISMKKVECKRPDFEATMDYVASHAPCAAIILQIKKKVQQLLDRAASSVMTAFASVIQKAQILETIGNSNLSKGQLLELPEQIARAVALFKEGVEQVSGQVTALQLSVFDLWPTLEPEALASLNVLPSDFDNNFTNISGIKDDTWQISSKRSTMHAWTQWLAVHDELVEPSLLSDVQPDECRQRSSDVAERRLSGMSEWSVNTSASDLSFSAHWQALGTDVASAIQSAVRKTVDSLMAPLDEGKQLGATRSSPELIVEQLLGELECAAAKVASMEVQMKKLKDLLKLSEMKRKDAEQKMAESLEQDLKNQAKAHLNIVDLTKQLRLKQSAHEELMHSRKSVKAKEMAKLQVDSSCKSVLQDMIPAAWSTKEELTALEETCRRKDATIARLKEEIVVLKNKVFELTTVPTPLVLKYKDHMSVTPVFSDNLLFNLDSPLKLESPPNANGPLLMERTDEWPHLSDADTTFILSGDKHKQQAECSLGSSSKNFHVSAPFSFGAPLADKSTCRKSLGSTIERHTDSKIGSFLHMGAKAGTSHHFKLRSIDLNSKQERRKTDNLTRAKRKEKNLRVSTNVLANIESNTPIMARRSCGKESVQRSLVNSLSIKAKENCTKRRRWI